ncbi:FAD-dependent oxidoreductase [Sodalis sp. dw_96]|uniref:FAD-dependent oxidoreductase n=1 Tax=Sodalis sp. dw_96 TaxID=2719794 RepID=UPI001BD31985|nr:FAD-dependent oxidoreductase [Sodalis sp. dw_96]
MKNDYVKKRLPALVALILGCSVGFSANAAVTAGDYTASAKGLDSDVKVTVSIDQAGTIKNIVADASGETPELGGVAGPQVAKSIVDHQSLDVDGMTGATETSDAVKQATKAALLLAGADIGKYTGGTAKTAAAPVADEEKTVDVVVMGGGTSGTAAALAAEEKGAKVLVVEKSAVVGGSGNMASGFFAVESSLQKSEGMKYTAADLTHRLLEYNHYLSNGPLTEAIVNKSGSTADWMAKHGVKFDIKSVAKDANQEQQAHRDDPIKADIYHHYLDTNAAYKSLYTSFLQSGGELMKNTAATSLIQDKDGQVTGLVAQKADGGKLIVHAKAVIIASGGFGGNEKMVRDVMNTPNIHVLAWPNQGEGTRMAWAAGGAQWNLHSALIHACKLVGITSSAAADQGNAENDSPLIWLLKSPLLWVDANGQRFGDEGLVYDTAYWANVSYSVGGKYYIVLDSQTLNAYTKKSFPFALSGAGPANPPKGGDFVALADAAVDGGKSKSIFKGQTIEELAKNMGVEAGQLEKTVSHYNDLIKAKSDPDFGKKPAYLVYPVKSGPFYAFETQVVSLSSIGGVRVNAKLQVTDINAKPIPGLYAVGNVAAGFYSGPGYPPYEGLANGFALNSGRIAGENAAETVAMAH